MFTVKTIITKPQNFSVANVTSRSITVTWLVPNYGKDAVDCYNLVIEEANDTFFKRLPNTGPNTMYNYTISNLSKLIYTVTFIFIILTLLYCLGAYVYIS